MNSIRSPLHCTSSTTKTPTSNWFPLHPLFWKLDSQSHAVIKTPLSQIPRAIRQISILRLFGPVSRWGNERLLWPFSGKAILHRKGLLDVRHCRLFRSFRMPGKELLLAVFHSERYRRVSYSDSSFSMVTAGIYSSTFDTAIYLQEWDKGRRNNSGRWKVPPSTFSSFRKPRTSNCWCENLRSTLKGENFSGSEHSWSINNVKLRNVTLIPFILIIEM